MNCSNCNHNAHYSSRTGRNMVGNRINQERNNCGNMKPARNACENMERVRDTCENMGRERNTCENMDRERNTCENMDRERNNCRNMHSERNTFHNMNQERNACRNMHQTRNSFKNMNNTRNVFERREMNRERCECVKEERNEGCDRGEEPVDRMAPGMAFVPWQEWKDIYDMEKGLERGTIFEELDKPYLGRSLK